MGGRRDRLNAVTVTNATLGATRKRRYLMDGGGLYLMISRRTPAKGGEKRKAADEMTKSWCFRYRSRGTGKLIELGLGSLLDVSLANARTKAADLRTMLADGRDPKTEVDQLRTAKKVEASRAMTFDEAAEKCIKDRKDGWKNEKHGDQWVNTLATYASPIIGKLPVAAIDLALVRKVLDPIWVEKNETASRVRQRIEAVLGWATVSGYRSGENPARWKNHLDHLLPAPAKVKKQENQPALPYSRLGSFMEALRKQDGLAPVALEFAILTACRSGEVLGARVEEFDLQRKLWTIPAERMKAKKEHVVPLSPRVVDILEGRLKREKGSFVFSDSPDEHFSDAAMLAVIRRMDGRGVKEGGEGWKDEKGRRVVPHGFRSTFRDWAGECSNFPREVIEHALAHQLKDKSEAAYARGTMLAKRKTLMESWAAFCDKPSEPMEGNVVPIRSALA